MWWGRYNRLEFEFKPFIDENGEIEKEIYDRVKSMTNGRADLVFDIENGLLTVWGLRPSGGSIIAARLPRCVCYQFCDMAHVLNFENGEIVEDNNTSEVLKTVKETVPSRMLDAVAIFKYVAVVSLTAVSIIGAIGIVRG